MKKEKELKKKLHSKKELKELNKLNRVTVGFNTGTRMFSTPRDYDRNKAKRELRSELKGE